MTLITAIAVLLALPAWIFAIEVLAGLRPLKSTTSGDAPPFAVLIPAHNEALGIGDTVMAVRAQLRRQDRLVVVADNCSDETAALARRAGAEVVERHDEHRRGKGFALAFGRDFLRAHPPAVAIVIDADCRLGPGALETLAAHAGRTGHAVQGAYLFEPAEQRKPARPNLDFCFHGEESDPTARAPSAGCARPVARHRHGLPLAAVRTRPARDRSCRRGHGLGLELLRQGHDVQWTEAASVSSLAATQSATVTQRTRWEHGFLATAAANVPKLTRSSITQRRAGLALLALDLLVPPLALLVGLMVIAAALAALLCAVTGSAAPLVLITSALAAVAISVALAWAAEGRRYVSLQTLFRAPAYILWKLPIYFRFLMKREKSWVRTDRG